MEACENAKVTWLALTATGTPVFNDDQWLCGKARLQLFDGYTAARMVKFIDIEYRIICSVTTSGLGQPLFSCSAFKEGDDKECASMTSLKCSISSNGILKRLGIKTGKNWSGVKFFGFDRKDVSTILENKLAKVRNPTQSETIQNEPTQVSAPNNSAINFTKCYTWLGVTSYGRKLFGDLEEYYLREHNGLKYHLPDGFISECYVKIDDDHHAKILCKIKAEGPTPMFICQSNDQEVSSKHPTNTVTQILKLVGCCS